MPIARSQFELGISASATEMNEVLSFLEAHRAEAYTIAEIAAALSLPDDDTADFLLWLQELDAVESRVLAGTPYYAFSRPIRAQLSA